MDEQDIGSLLIAFITSQCQLLLSLELFLNNNKRITHVPPDIRHRIRQLAYFYMIHKYELVCRQNMRIDRRCFAILCQLLKTICGLASTKIIDFKEMVAMFLHVLAHDVKNRVIQREFLGFGETSSQHFYLVLLTVLRMDDELLKKPQPVTNVA
ncbi:hypothetical protein IC582_024364 [Cucumis melo]